MKSEGIVGGVEESLLSALGAAGDVSRDIPPTTTVFVLPSSVRLASYCRRCGYLLKHPRRPSTQILPGLHILRRS